MKNSLAVSELFYSLQGEGPTMGVPSVFLRLTACNLMCGGKGTEKDMQLHDGATWRCDTIEVWKKGKHFQFEDVLADNYIENLRNGAHLIITGGEPLLQQNQIVAYLLWFKQHYGFSPYVEIETNGTIPPNNSLFAMIHQFNVSPKLSNSGMRAKYRIVSDALAVLNRHSNSCMKFVVTHEDDWVEIKSLIDIYSLKNVWLMPGASSQNELLSRNASVARLALQNNLKFSTRLQVEIWDQVVGV